MLKKKIRISIEELTTIIIISIINVCFCKNYYSNIFSLRTFYIQFTSIFIFVLLTAVPRSCWVRYSSCDWLVSSATQGRGVVSTHGDQNTNSHDVTHTAPGEETRRPCGERPGTPENAKSSGATLEMCRGLEVGTSTGCERSIRVTGHINSCSFYFFVCFLFFLFLLYSSLVCAETVICDSHRAQPRQAALLCALKK